MRKVLWAPWRMEFIAKAHRNKTGSCIFCSLPKKRPSDKTLVLYRGSGAYVMLNKYPYNNGHLLVIPVRHFPEFHQLKTEEHLEIGDLISRSIRALRKELKAQGFNVGLNLGKVAGAGIEGHLHYHLVPRWNGDSNFMPIFGDVRMMPEHIGETYRKLKRHF